MSTLICALVAVVCYWLLMHLWARDRRVRLTRYEAAWSVYVAQVHAAYAAAAHAAAVESMRALVVAFAAMQGPAREASEAFERFAEAWRRRP